MRIKKILMLLIVAIPVLTGVASNLAKSKGAPASGGDAIVADIAALLAPQPNLPKKELKRIERNLRGYPEKIVRRDTASFYLQYALKLAYYEFVKADSASAAKTAALFSQNLLESNPLKMPIKYGLFKMAIQRMGYCSWKKPSVIKGLDVKESALREERRQFIGDFLLDIPLDLSFDSYRQLLDLYKANGGAIYMLCYSMHPDFVKRCREAGRVDILDYMMKLWPDSPELRDEEVVVPVPEEVREDAIAMGITANAIRELELGIYDADGNLEMADNLIYADEPDSIGKYIFNYQNLQSQRGQLRDLIFESLKYEPFIIPKYQKSYYSFIGTAYLNLQEYDQAQSYFKKALTSGINPSASRDALINLSLAITLAEKGQYEEVREILENVEPLFDDDFSRYRYLDAKGYAYSKFDRVEALACFVEADSLLEAGFSYTPGKVDPIFLDSNKSKHFVMEARLVENDIFKWREALYNAWEDYSENSYFNFYGNIEVGFYYSEFGRFRNYLFDFEGAKKAFELALERFENLDDADYRWKFFDESWQDINLYTEGNLTDVDELRQLISDGPQSPLHKIWLLLNLANRLNSREALSAEDLRYINTHLKSNLVEAIMALSSTESSHLIQGVTGLQRILRGAENDEANIEQLANLNLLRKGLLQTSKRALEKTLHESGAHLAADYAELKRMRHELNDAYAYEDSLKVKQLLPRIVSKERKIYHSLGDSIDLGQHIGYDVAGVKAALGANDIGIDFIELPDGEGLKTGAFIISKDAPAAYVELNPEMTDEGADFKNIWVTLGPFLEGKENIYFAPDGRLLNRGIEFYPDADGRPAIHNRRLHRLAHLRNLETRDGIIDGDYLLIGVSDHNSPVKPGKTVYRGNWSDMQDVDYEIRVIKEALAGKPCRVLMNDEATEERVKNIKTDNVAVLHFSTHGVYRSLDDLRAASENPDDFDHNIARRTLKSDREDICALILRGGNLAWKAPHILDEEDDILTDDEIELMSFPNLELTVLSACDSGLGRVDADGMWGLVRAFRIAGSKKLICSLNKVNDYWTAQFMGLLYQYLRQGMTVYDAFRKAQQKVYESVSALPKIWASFILIE